MKSSKETPPKPGGDVSFTTGKPRPPEPPPMRKINDDPSFGFIAPIFQAALIVIIGALIYRLCS